MDDTAMDDEDTKRFDSVHGGNDEDNQPDPDEALMMDSGNGRVWLVKVRIYVSTTACARFGAMSPGCGTNAIGWRNAAPLS